MTLPPLAYARPTSLDEATELLLDPAARPLAGGQSLVPALAAARGNAMAGAASGAAAPLTLVDLSCLPDLDRIVSTPDGGLRIGALVTQRAAERSGLVAERAPLLVEALGEVGHPSTRNRGTVVGSVAHADPAAEVPAVAVALGASVVIAGTGGTRREVPVAGLLGGAPHGARVEQHPAGSRPTGGGVPPHRLPLEPGELLVELRLPSPVAGERHAWLEFAPRRFDLPLVGAAVRLAPDGRAQLTLAGVADAPTTADLGVHTTSRSAVIEETIAALDPPTDARATSALRRHLARTLALRALESARG